MQWVKPVGTTLYHYTSIDALCKILTTNTLWATKYSYQNDASEIEYGINLLAKCIEEKSAHKERLLGAIATFKAKTLSDYYFLSFSFEKDSLPMWNYYGSSSRKYGVTLGLSPDFLDLFYPSSLMNGVLKNHPKLLYNSQSKKTSNFIVGAHCREVIYDVQFQENIFDKIIQLTDRCIEGNIHLWKLMFGCAAEHIIFMKDPCASSEREFRLAFRIPQKEVKHFRLNDTFLVPYIVCQYGLQRHLTEIILSPYNKSDIAKAGLEEFLESLKLDNVSVSFSSLPNRY